jgi:hypothetical protein
MISMKNTFRKKVLTRLAPDSIIYRITDGIGAHHKLWLKFDGTPYKAQVYIWQDQWILFLEFERQTTRALIIKLMLQKSASILF